jgi:hypothetical protein
VFFAIFGLEFPKPQITHPDMVGTSDDVGLRGFRGFLWIFVLGIFYREGAKDAKGKPRYHTKGV